MEIIQANDEGGSKFIALEEGVESGRILFTRQGTSTLVIQHTLVKPKFKGKNIGTLLVLETVNFARKEKLKIVPVCPFAKSVFEKREDIRDVLENLL